MLKGAEERYPAVEGEPLALVWAVTGPFRHYIHMHAPGVEVQMDHQALKYLMTSTNLSGHLARWALAVGFTVTHKPGAKHTNVDGLSRLPCPDQPAHPPTPPEVQPAVVPLPGAAVAVSGGMPSEDESEPATDEEDGALS